MAAKLPSDLIRIAAIDVLSDTAQDIARDAAGLILTGYSANLKTEEQEGVQSWLRAAYNESQKRPFTVIVLCEEFPSADTSSIEMAWYNGPFQGHKVYSIEPNARGVDIVEYYVTDDNEWKINETRQI